MLKQVQHDELEKQVFGGNNRLNLNTN